MTKRSKHTLPWRVLWLIPVGLIAALSIVATGGSGGDDDGLDDVEAPLVILPNYNFFLGNLNDGALLTADVGGEFTATIDIDGLLAGNLDLDVDANNTVTFLSYLIRAGNSIDIIITSPEGSPLDGTISVTVTSDIVATVDEPPTSGVFTVFAGPPANATVTILANGVQLALGAGEAIDYTWEEYTALQEDELAETWQRHASLAGSALQFIIEQFFSVADILDDLELVTLNNPLVATCDMFTGSPPEGVLAQGQVTVTWLGSGELSDGDDFTWELNNCWSLDDEELFDGTVSLEDYTESVDFNSGVLFSIGFGGLGAGAPGGVIFDLTFSETVEAEGVWTIPADGVIALSGGFVLNIQQP